MTPKLSSLTNDAMRVLVAEAMGWIKVRQHWEKDDVSAYLNDSHCHTQLPNFPGDLNACAKMEQTLTPEEQAEYSRHLASNNDCQIYALYHATAEQRVRAYLVAKGLADL